MSKRNFILLIIILLIAVAGVFGFLYIRSGGSLLNGGGDSGGTNFFSIFNPFSSDDTSTPTEDPALDIDGDGVVSDEEMALVKLVKVSTVPVAGFTVFTKERLKEVPIPAPVVEAEGGAPIKTKPTTPVAPPTEFATALRYVDKATGNIYQTFADKIEERRFSETIIPKVYDAYFGNNGQSVVMRRLKSNDVTIESFYGLLPKEKLGEDMVSNELKGAFLPEGIKDISLSPDASKIFYLSNFGESIIGTTLSLSDTKKTQVFDSAFTEWNSSWPTLKTIALNTKPSSEVPGHMYTLDVDKKGFMRVLGGINGLTTLMSPDGKRVLVGNNTVSLYIYRMDTKTYETLGINTIPEKCVWGKTNITLYCAVPVNIEGTEYPDNWYRGEVSFSDQIWKINLIDGSTYMLADPILVPKGEDIDGIKLAVDAKEEYLFFINKKDSFLWKLDLK